MQQPKENVGWNSDDTNLNANPSIDLKGMRISATDCWSWKKKLCLVLVRPGLYSFPYSQLEIPKEWGIIYDRNIKPREININVTKINFHKIYLQNEKYYCKDT